MKNKAIKTSLTAALAVIAVALSACGYKTELWKHASIETVEAGYVGSYHFASASGSCTSHRYDEYGTDFTIAGEFVEWKWVSTPDDMDPEIVERDSDTVAFLPTQPGTYVLSTRYECGDDSVTAEAEIIVTNQEPLLKMTKLLSSEESSAHLRLHNNTRSEFGDTYFIQDLDGDGEEEVLLQTGEQGVGLSICDIADDAPGACDDITTYDLPPEFESIVSMLGTLQDDGALLLYTTSHLNDETVISVFELDIDALEATYATTLEHELANRTEAPALDIDEDGLPEFLASRDISFVDTMLSFDEDGDASEAAIAITFKGAFMEFNDYDDDGRDEMLFYFSPDRLAVVEY